MSRSTPDGGRGTAAGDSRAGAQPTTPGAPGHRRWWQQHWLRHLVGLAVVLGVLLGLARPLQVTPAPVTSDHLVVIGVGERTSLLPLDRELLDTRSTGAAYGVVSASRDEGECVSAAWLSLGAGTQARTGDQCAPELVLTPAARLSGSGVAAISNWSQLTALNTPYGVDLGVLQRSIPAEATDPTACLEAVGPGAALAAAGADGSVGHYLEPSTWAAGDYASHCRVTLVDPVLGSEALIRRLAGRADTTVLVVGLGPAGELSRPFRLDPTGTRTIPSIQLAYRLDPTGSAATAGALSSDTTTRSGVVSLADVSATVIARLRDPSAVTSSATPSSATPSSVAASGGTGAALGVVPGAVSASAADRLLADVTALQRRGPIMATAAGIFAALLIGALVVVLRRRWGPAPWLAGALTTWPVALLVGGLVPWYGSPQPVLTGIGALVGCWIVAVLLARLLTTPRRPTGIAGAAMSLTVTAASAVVGDGLPWGTLLDSTTALGPDWLGVGPGAAGVCVGAALAIAAWWAERLPRRQSVVAIVGLVVIIGVALWPNVAYALALLAGGAVLTFADTARDWVRQAIPWADPLFVGTAAACLVAALVGTALVSLVSGTVLLQLFPDSPRFGGVVMGWLASVTLAVWLQLRAPEWFAARDEGRLPDPTSI